MKATRKVAIKLCQYLGVSKGATRNVSKSTAEELSKLLSGKSKKEKKEFLKSLAILADDSRKTGEASNFLYRSLKCNSPVIEESRQGWRTYSALTTPLMNKRVTNELRTKIPKIIETGMHDLVNKSIAEVMTPENMSRMVKEAYKETLKQGVKDAGTMLYRLVASPINLIRKAFVPKSKVAMYDELVSLPKSQFRENFYQRLISKKGIADRAPATPVVTDKSGGCTPLSLFFGTSGVEGGFNGFTNKINFTKEFNECSRGMQANLISHELRHFEQADQIIRTFGIERYIQAKKTYVYNQLAKMPEFANASPAKIQEEVLKFMEANNFTDDVMKAAFEKSISAPRINPNSVKGQRAKKYLEATENYEGLTRKNLIFTERSKSYLKNPLEVEAYKIGNKTGAQVGIIEDLNLMNI